MPLCELRRRSVYAEISLSYSGSMWMNERSKPHRFFGGFSILLVTAFCQAQVAAPGTAGGSSIRAPDSSVPPQSTAGGSAGAPATPEDKNAEATPTYKIGGDVRPPVLIHSVDPEFSRADRSQSFNGTVHVDLTIDVKGVPQNVHVVQGVGEPFDQSAVKAVSRYRFKPATKDGIPVPVELHVSVNIRIR